MKQAPLIVVTGLSGAGKSTALHAFEDLGYFCIDNLPPPLLPNVVDIFSKGAGESARICVGMDIREKHFLEGVLPAIESLRARGRKVAVLFLDASDGALLSRFRETRRRHPLGADLPPREAIEAERRKMEVVQRQADQTLDTSAFSTHTLREWILETFGAGREGWKMTLSVLSFAYRKGLPAEADLVLDVRFLPNPNFVAGLREKDGRDEEVSRYVLQSEPARRFLSHWEPLFEMLLDSYEREGKAYLTIAFGCTGGQHRSVALARWAERWLRGKGYAPRLVHRDLPAPSSAGQGEMGP